MFDLLRFPGDLLAEYDRLHRELDHLFGSTPAAIRATTRGAFPAINIGSTPQTVEIYAFLPGVDPAQLDVSVERGLLTISGERRNDWTSDEKRAIHARERFTGQFKRTFSLPEDVDQNQVEAHYRDGILRIVAAKLEASLPRRIEIK